MKGKYSLVVKKCRYCGQSFLGSPNSQYCSKECMGLYRSLYYNDDLARRLRKETLCWECKKATGGEDCPWANEFKPVEGWTAIPTLVKVQVGQKEQSYIVSKCPLFVEG